MSVIRGCVSPVGPEVRPFPEEASLRLDRADTARDAVDPARLTAYRSSAEREAWWLERLTRAAALLRGKFYLPETRATDP